MKSAIDNMIKLQEIEIQISQERRVIESAPERLRELKTILEEFERKVESEKSVLADLKKQYRNGESEAQNNLEHIKKSRAKLPSIKNNREYQALLKEIEDIKAKNSLIEDSMIAFLDRIEAGEGALADQNREYEDLKCKLAAQSKLIEAEIEGARKKMDRLENSWREISDQLAPDLMKKILRLREDVGVIFIAPVKRSVCYGCHMNIPPQMYNELQRCDSLKFCPHCERLLYWDQS
jgi:predicted  nucleic acid-binding Zn-ribbon protein